MLGKLLGKLILFGITLVVITIVALNCLYKPITSGTLHLANARGEAQILREVDTSIPHVHASSEQMAVYSQGFIHAQERLWQMEKSRRLTQGGLSEIFGERALPLDKFHLTIGFRRAAEDAYASMDEYDKDLLHSYADGINDFISGISPFGSDSTARLLPPEFYAVGLSSMRQWHPVDSLCIIKLLNFHLSWNWNQDLYRDVLSHISPELSEFVDEIFPYTSEHSYNMVTIMDDDDTKQFGFYSDISLLDKRRTEINKRKQKIIDEKVGEINKEMEEQKRQFEEEQRKDREEQKKRDEENAKQREVERQKVEKTQKLKEEAKRLMEEQNKKEEQEKQQAKKVGQAKEKSDETLTEEEKKEKMKEWLSKEVKQKGEERKEEKIKEYHEKQEQLSKQEEEKEKVDQKEKMKEWLAKEVEERGKVRMEEKKKEHFEQQLKQQSDENENVKETETKVKRETKPSRAKQDTIKEKAPEIDPHSYTDDQMASNNWVIHGNHTKNGKPLLASDPHLSNGIPSHWYLMGLYYGDNFSIGSTYPGLPFCLIGRNKHFSWGMTSVLSDVSDLYREKLNEDQSEYMVDGKWKAFTVIVEDIMIKGQDKPYKYKVRLSHRGPLVDQEILGGAQTLFAEGLPKIDSLTAYSLAWTGLIKQDETVKILRSFNQFKSAQDLNKFLIDLGEYRSIPQNLIFAFENGDIAYFLLASAPKRKQEIPYIGCKVFDGTTSKNDWDGILGSKDLPRVINPKKGYIVTANNRVMPDNVKYDLGATITSTVRAQRITELIQNGISSGHKFDYKDMMTIQQDQVDLMARDIVAPIVKIVYSMIEELSKQEKEDIELVIPFLQKWHGEMTEESVAASIYSVWQLQFYNTLFHSYIDDQNTRITITNNYPFIDFIQKLIHTIKDAPDTEKYNKLCKGAFAEYKGTRHCSYNIAKSLALAKQFLVKEVSKKSEDWQWRNIHVNEYANQPWSMTILRPFFHREVPCGGNGNTINVSKYSFKKAFELRSFKSQHTANYKQVIQIGTKPEETKSFYCHDGGQNGNLFGGHYFDFNRKHLDGDLLEMIIGKAGIEQVPHETLVLKKKQIVVEKKQEVKKEEKHRGHKDEEEL